MFFSSLLPSAIQSQWKNVKEIVLLLLNGTAVILKTVSSLRFKIFSNQSALESLAVSFVSFLFFSNPKSSIIKKFEMWVFTLTDHLVRSNVFLSQLIPLQAPIKTMLQMSVVPLINSKNLQRYSRVDFNTLWHWLLWWCFTGNICVTVFRLDKERSSDPTGWWDGFHWGGGWISQRKSVSKMLYYDYYPAYFHPSTVKLNTITQCCPLVWQPFCRSLQGFIVIGANLHFSKGLREMIAGSAETEQDTV